MPTITVTLPDGSEREVEGEFGRSLMEILRDNDIDDILAVCGGACACATCHVFIDPSYMPQVGEASAIEEDLLSCSLLRQENSRLSCQIEFTQALVGLRLVVAPED